MSTITKLGNKSVFLGILTLFLMAGIGYFTGAMFPPTAISQTNPGTCLPIEKGGTGCDDQELVKYFSNVLYPVGSILTTTASTNPSSYLGGNWQAFGNGRTLIGVDTSQTEFNTVEKSGGSKTHTLTVNEIPSHTHNVYGKPNAGSYNGQGIFAMLDSTWGSIGTNPTFGQDSPIARATGGGAAHNNLQPYIAVYFWKRVS